MNKFKYKFSTKIFVVIAIGFVLCAVCFVWNIVRLVNLIVTGLLEPYPIISISLAILMSVAFAVIMSAMLIDSGYVFENKLLITKFGIIKSSTDYKKIKQLVWFKENNKLTMFFDDESFTDVVISDNEYELFAEALLEKNPKIKYYVNIDEKK